MRKLIAFLYLAVFLACAAPVLWSDTPLDLSGGRPEKSDPALRERLGYAARDEKAKAGTPFFSPSGHFHTGPIAVSIASLWPEARIYYTTDGSEPTENSAPYRQPLSLEAEAASGCVVVKAVAVSGGRTSPAAAHSYFFDPDIKNRFTSYVFSLSTDKGNLYDYEYGILVPGKRRADAVALHPDRAADAHDANYKGRGREWERPVYVEAFTPDGTRIVSQRAGLRVFGGGTRHYAQKSLRLTARKFYEPRAGKFKFPFFPELALASAKNPSPMLSWDSLILSNGGDDPNKANIRTSLLSRIAAEAGYPYVAPAGSAAVFLNGKYYGHAFLTTRLDDSFLAELYDAPKDNFIILAGGVKQLRSSPKYPYSLHRRIIKNFNGLTKNCELAGMNEYLYHDIQKQIDIDMLLLYYAIEVYIDNQDWGVEHEDNIKAWRYYGDGNASSELDGRWRFILYDLSNTAAHPSNREASLSRATLRKIVKTHPLFGALMQRPDLAEKFANHFCDMAFVHFAEPNVRKVMDALDGESRKEIEFAARHGGGGSPGLPEHIARDRENMLAFFRERPEHALRELRDLFGYTGLYHVIVDGPAKVNTVASGGWYFVENPVVVTPAPPWGKAVKHWEVNGEIRDGERLDITARDAVDGLVRVKLVTEEKPSPLVIEAAYDRDGICGFSIRNVTDKTQDARNLYLSDKPDKPRKQPMAGIAFAPGESLDFVGKGCRHADALLKLKVNFNPRRGETVYLRDKTGEILSSSEVR